MTRTRIATGIAALAVAAGSITLIVPATFAHAKDDAPAQCVPGTCAGDPLPGTEDPAQFDIGTPPSIEGDAELGGGDAPSAP